MNHSLSEANFSEPQIPEINYATPAYAKLLTETSHNLSSNRHITYVPFNTSQLAAGAEHLSYADSVALPTIMKDVDAIICLSRDEDPSPDYTDQSPEYNITLTPSGRSNVDASVALWKLASRQGNSAVQFIATGRMHNRAVRGMLALPVVAEHVGLNAEDLYHMPELRFKQLLEAGFTHKNIASLKLDTTDPELGASRKALIELFQDPKYAASIPTTQSTDEELQTAADTVWQEYKAYPRISTSRLMIERAAQAGVPLESIYEEDGAVDTITNLINTAEMLESSDSLKDKPIRKVVLVAGSDHLPRTMWIADHILPDDIEIVCVESSPALSQTDYDESCTRELGSYRKGSKWIGGTRDLKELTDITEAGYFGVERKDSSELAQEIAASRRLGTISLEHS